MILAGVAKLGFVADLLSKPTQIGYMNGLALTILIGQLPKLFGFSIDADGLIDEARGFVDGVADGATVGAALAIGLASLAVILVLQRSLPKVPAVLIAVVLAIAAVEVVRPRGAWRVGRRHAAGWLPTAHDPRRLVVGPARCWSAARWASPRSPSPTRSRRPRRSPPAAAITCTATRR